MVNELCRLGAQNRTAQRNNLENRVCRYCCWFPAWLRRSGRSTPPGCTEGCPKRKSRAAAFATESCRYKPLFGEGDSEARVLRSVSRFGEMEIAAHGNCQPEVYAREEEIYFVVSGRGVLHYGDAVARDAASPTLPTCRRA